MPSKKQGKDKKKQKPPGKPMKKKGKAKPAKGKKGAKSEGSKKKKSTWLKRISSGEEAKSSVSIAPLSPPKEKETPTISRTTRLEYPTLDLMALTADEENIIKAVLNNDDEFQKLVDQKVSGLRNEIRIIRKKSSQETSKKKVTRKCIRCNQPLAIWRLVIPFLDKGARCQRCHFIVCQGCRHRQSNGLWLCALCVRYREIQYLTGEWFCKNKGLTGSDLVRFSLNKKDATFSHHEMPQESVPKEGLDSHKAAESLSEEDKSKVGKKDSIIKKDKHKGSLKAKTKEGKGKAAKGKGAKGKGAKDKGAKGKEGKTKPGKAPKGGKKPKKGKAPKGGKEHKGEKAPKGDKQKKGSKAGKNKSKNANENQRNMNVSYSNPEGQCHSIKCGTSDEKESEDEETYSKDTSRVDSGSNFSKSSHESLPIGASAAQLERTGRKQKAMPSSELFSQGTESSSKCYSRSVHGDSSLINISSYMIDDLCISFSDTENWIQYVRSKSPETYNVDTLRGRNHIRQSTEHVHKEKRKNKNSSIHSRRILKTDDDSIWNENCGNSRSMLSLGKIKGPTRSNRTRSKEKSKVQVNCIFDNANSSVHKLRYGNDEYSKAISANLNKYVSTALDEKSKYSAAISYPQEKHARKHSTCQISASCAKKIFLESHDFDFNMQSVSELHKNDSNRSEECAHLSSSEKGNTKQSKSEVTGTSNISSLPESDDEIIKMETESRGSNSRSSKSLNACGKEKNVNVANKKLFESFCKNTVVRRMRCLVAYFLDINESASSGLKRIVDVNVLDKNRNFHAEQSRGISPLQDKNDKPQEVYRRTSSLKDKDTTEKKKSISGKHGKGKKKEASDSKSSKDEKRKGSLRKSEDGKASTDRRPHASQGKTGKKNSVSGKRGKGKKKEASDSKSSKDEKRKGSLRKSEDGKASNDRKASTDRRPTSSIVAIGSMDPVLESDQKSPEGFTFGTPASNTSTTTGGGGGSGISGSNIFSFAANSGITPGAGTNVFGGLGVSTAVAPSTGFNFTNAATKATTGTSGSFGGFTFGSTSQTQAAPTSTAGGLTFGTAAIGGGLTLGTTSTGSSVFGSVKPATVATTSGPALTGFSGFGTTTTSLGGTGGSLLGGLLSSTSSSVSVPSVAVTTAAAASSDFTFGTTAGTSSFNFGATTTTSTTATTTALTQSFSFGSTPSLPATSVSALANSLGTGNIPGTSSASTSASTSASAAPGLSGTGVPGQKHMTFRQLEETINKWTTELEEQEKYFLDQATQVNAWDRIVIENGERIIQLNKDVEKVKLDQQKLDHELDFVHSQQKELEDIITNLEKALDSLPPISYQQHADVEREHTYVLAESLDSQLKRMGQDLKEIIERLNSTNTTPDPNDPVQQITKILNAHVVSLMWVDRNTANLQRRVEEISKQMDIEKREQERNFRLAYS